MLPRKVRLSLVHRHHHHPSRSDAELAKQYLVNSDLLSYGNGEELQQVMDVFIREVRRPTGELYLPESIYYLCLGTSERVSLTSELHLTSDSLLGIQFYLNINNRQIDLFDPRYIEFNSTLNTLLLPYTPRLSPDGKTTTNATNNFSFSFSEHLRLVDR